MRPLVTVGIPGPIGSRERHLGPSVVLLPRTEAGEPLFAFAVPAVESASTSFCPYSASSASGGVPA
jgi:hypothetical protein